MNSRKTLANDPKLTAYALGELDGFERASVETALRDDPAARAAVEEIRALSAQLEGALAGEAMAEADKEKKTPAHARAAIIQGHDPSKLDGGGLVNGHRALARPLANVIKFPQFYYVVGGLAVACFAVMVAMRTPKPMPQRENFATQMAAPVASIPVALPNSEAAGTSGAAGAAAAGNDQVADAAASTTVVLSLAPSSQNGPQAPSPTFSANLSLLGQTKDGAQKKIRETTLGGSLAPESIRSDGLRALSKSEAQPQMVSSAAFPAPPITVSGGNQITVNTAVEPDTQMRVQRVSATQTYPADEKMLVEARPKSATRVAPAAPASSSLFEQAVKQGTGTLSFSGGPPLASAGALTFGAGSNFAGGAGARAIFDENRGRPGYTWGDFYNAAPAGAGRPAGAASADRYAEVKDNDFLGAAQNPLSTFSIDVDTASYSNVRRFLRAHQKPPRDAVRVEELVNYFPYRYAPPAATVPFAASLEVAQAPWAPTHRLVRIGLKGREVSSATRPAANLVFLLDVSGSMAPANRLPLVKEAMRLLVGKLRPDDRVAIVTYAGQSGLALPSTPVSRANEILAALDDLKSGGPTNGAMGIQLAYDIAKANFSTGGINRVILCTDGDFNVGVTNDGDLTRLVEEKAKSGVALTALGFGMGNLKDARLEKLADRGNGNYGYIDTRREAEKILVEQVNGTLLMIAKDVKIQVDFNPARVASYRLIGYENRLLKKEDFNNDAVDAGEIGAGHTVTALYEIVPVGAEDKSAPVVATVEESKYAPVASAKREVANPKFDHELLTVRMRYKEPASDESQRLDFPLTDSGATFENASTDFKFAAAVAGFGMILRESPHKGTSTMADVVTWAEAGNTDDSGGYRAEFVELAREAEKLTR